MVQDLFGTWDANWLAQGLAAVARLGVADVLADGQVHPVDDIAKQTGSKPEPLYRLLRWVASHGVFEETNDHQFRMNEKASLLKEDHPMSLKWLFAMVSSAPIYQTWGHLVDYVRTGAPGFSLPDTGYLDHYSYLQDHPVENKVFNNAMVGFSNANQDQLVKGHDWSQYKVIADVGGGHGTLLQHILHQNPGVKGVVLELPQVVDAAPAIPADLKGRFAFVKGNYYASVPVEADCYLMKNVMHQMSDEHCRTVLNNIKAGARNATIVDIDNVLPGPNEGPAQKTMDVSMMVMTNGGHERTFKEWEDLLHSAGLKLEHVRTPPGQFQSILTIKPQK
eukprot:jgi/Chrzof1/11135/Cz05g25060.t1